MTRRRGLRLVLVPALCLVSVATMAMAARGDAAGPAMAIAASSYGSLSIFNSRGDQAVLSVAGLAPRRSTSGDVTIQNNGAVAGGFSLAGADLAETPGLGGGLLSQRLELAVIDLGASGTVYTGPLAGLGSRELGIFAPGEARTYRFIATLPDTGTPPSPVGGDNAYQGASLRNTYVWTATELDAPATPPTGNPAPGGAPSQLTPLQLRITLLRRQPPLRKGKLVFKVWCNNACAFRAKGTLAHGGGQARSKAWASLHHSGRLKLRISRRSTGKLTRALRSKRGTRMNLYVTARDSFGRTASLRRMLALKRVGRGKRSRVSMAWSTRR